MAIHCCKCVARALTLALVIHAASMEAAAQNVASGNLHDTTANQATFAQPFRFNAPGLGPWRDVRYEQSLTDRYKEAPAGRAKPTTESVGEGTLRRQRELHRYHSWKVFIPFSAAVYTMGLLDQTATIGHGDWRVNEQDPLVKPFTQVPAPVFVAGGVAFETGVNWLAWRMGRSRRWHEIWWLPQICAVGANAYGYDISMHR
jgi:hypothetical protein